MQQYHKYTTDFPKGKPAVIRQQRDSDAAGRSKSRVLTGRQFSAHRPSPHPCLFCFLLLDKEPCQYYIQLF